MWTPDLTGRIPVKYLAIVEALAEAVECGDLQPGVQLPTHRELAWRLKVNVSTVTQAYREAARRHLVSGEVGRGTYVLADSREAALFGLKELHRSDVIDLSTNVPAIDLSNGDLDAALKEIAAKGDLSATQAYHSPQLIRRSQIAAASWLAWRGFELRPGNIIACAGAQQALMTALLALCRPGDGVLVEELTFPGMKAVGKQLGLRLQGIALDAEGALPAGLDRMARASGARVVVLVPSLQNPTGAVMSAQRRRAIAEVIRRRDLFLIEDDVYGGLTDLPALASELPERSIVVSSLSKTVAPGLRFGMIAGLAPVVQSLAGEIHATSWQLSPLMCEIACRWLESGVAQRRVAWQRAEVGRRYRMAAPILLGRPEGPGKRHPSPHVWLPLGGNCEERALACRRRGVELVAGSLFAVGREVPTGLRASIAAPASWRELSLALARLKGCAAEWRAEAAVLPSANLPRMPGLHGADGPP
jgi:DNA-binding transcriptional MocR family regulator